MKTITLAFTGASGLPYGLRLLECLLAGGQRVHMVYSQAAQIVAKQELESHAAEPSAGRGNNCSRNASASSAAN